LSLVIVTVRDALLVPTAWLPKFTDEGFTWILACPAVARPNRIVVPTAKLKTLTLISLAMRISIPQAAAFRFAPPPCGLRQSGSGTPRIQTSNLVHRLARRIVDGKFAVRLVRRTELGQDRYTHNKTGQPRPGFYRDEPFPRRKIPGGQCSDRAKELPDFHQGAWAQDAEQTTCCRKTVACLAAAC
jgi:hypothetical protein